MRRLLLLTLVVTSAFLTSCHAPKPQIVIGSKFFTEQVVLAELLAQHIEARTGIHVERKTNLGGTLLVHKAMQAGQVDLYAEYTGTALTAVLNESPTGDSSAVYQRVKQLYGERFNFEVTEPLGFENTFAMVIRGEDAQQLHLRRMSDLVPIAPKWRIGVGFEFLERSDGFRGWSERYGLEFAPHRSGRELGLIYRAFQDHKVDMVAGNSTHGVIDSLHLVILEDDRHYFPPYDSVPIVRRDTLKKFPQLRATLAELSSKVTGADMRHLNYLGDGAQRDVAAVVREYRQSHNL